MKTLLEKLNLDKDIKVSNKPIRTSKDIEYKFSSPEIENFCLYIRNLMEPEFKKCRKKDSYGDLVWKGENEKLTEKLHNIFGEIYNYFNELDIENSRNTEHIPFYIGHLEPAQEGDF